jgi:hypothetical protein
VINTPDEGAIKWWIGNAAEDGKAATVFARLKVPASDGKAKILNGNLYKTRSVLQAVITHMLCCAVVVLCLIKDMWPLM